MQLKSSECVLEYERDEALMPDGFESMAEDTNFELAFEVSTGYRQVQDSLGVPYRWICSIIIEFAEPVVSKCGDSPKNTVFGSGLLITFGHVLTSAHMLIGFKCHGKNGLSIVKPRKITVIPGRDDGRILGPRPFREYTVETYKVPQGYLSNVSNNRSAAHDYALLTLKKRSGKHAGHKKFLKLGGNLGWWGRAYNSYIKAVSSSFRQHLATRKVNVAGYPFREDPNFTNQSTPAGLMYHDFERVINAFPRLGSSVVPMLSYEATTGKSMSGSPVWVYNDSNGRRYLVAIHRGRYLFGGYADAVLITSSVIAQLVLWGVKREWLSIT